MKTQQIAKTEEIPPVVTQYQRAHGIEGLPKLMSFYHRGEWFEVGTPIVVTALKARAWAREGITSVNIDVGAGRLADFATSELLLEESWDGKSLVQFHY